MILELLGGLNRLKGKAGSYEWTLKDGRTVELRVTIKDADAEPETDKV